MISWITAISIIIFQHNEIHYAEYEELIHSNPDAYYKHREAVFSVRPATLVVSPSIIHEPQNALLREISRMLNSQKTNLRIVISPLYESEKIQSGRFGVSERPFR